MKNEKDNVFTGKRTGSKDNSTVLCSIVMDGEGGILTKLLSSFGWGIHAATYLPPRLQYTWGHHAILLTFIDCSTFTQK